MGSDGVGFFGVPVVWAVLGSIDVGCFGRKRKREGRRRRRRRGT